MGCLERPMRLANADIVARRAARAVLVGSRLADLPTGYRRATICDHALGVRQQTLPPRARYDTAKE